MNIATNTVVRTYTWLVRREFWENRAAWILPTVIGGLMLVVAMFGHLQTDEFPAVMNESQLQAAGPVLFGGIVSAFFVVMSVYTAWYLLDCLSAERKETSHED